MLLLVCFYLFTMFFGLSFIFYKRTLFVDDVTGTYKAIDFIVGGFLVYFTVLMIYLSLPFTSADEWSTINFIFFYLILVPSYLIFFVSAIISIGYFIVVKKIYHSNRNMKFLVVHSTVYLLYVVFIAGLVVNEINIS
jgi:hypothetical protein